MIGKRFTIDKDYDSDGDYEYCFVDNETGRVFNWAEDWIFDDFLELVNAIISNQIKENEQLKQSLDYEQRMHEWFRNEAYLLQNKLNNREDEIRRLKGDCE